MIDGEKIIMMTKLAVYDKNLGGQDRKILEYFRHDYIYRKNFWTRACAVTGAFILLLFYWADKILVQGTDVTELDLRQTGVDILTYLTAAAVFFTLIGTLIAAIEYSRAKKRHANYKETLRKLNSPGEEAPPVYYGNSQLSPRVYR